MKRTALMLALAVTLLFTTGFAITTPVQAAAPAAAGISIPVVGTGTGTLTGTLNLQRFAATNGQLLAIGTIVGTVTNTATGVVTSIVQNVALPVTIGQTACDILHLDLGPLHLDVLGLQIDLNQVVLDITAQPGPGNLLGNLLCSVAHLLDNPSALANLLNRILAAL